MMKTFFKHFTINYHLVQKIYNYFSIFKNMTIFLYLQTIKYINNLAFFDKFPISLYRDIRLKKVNDHSHSNCSFILGIQKFKDIQKKKINKNDNDQNILTQNMLCQADIMHELLDNVVSNSMDGDADFSLLTAHLMNYYFDFNSVQMLVDNNGKFIF